MPDETAPNPMGRPKLLAFVRLQYDKARDRWVIQAPERVLVLDETGKEIVELCNGERSIEEIVDQLASTYDAPRDVIEHDVNAVIQVLRDKGVLDVHS